VQYPCCSLKTWWRTMSSWFLHNFRIHISSDDLFWSSDIFQFSNLYYVYVLILLLIYEGVPRSFWTEAIVKYMLTTINTHWEAVQRVMVAELTRLTQKIAIQLHLVAESCSICSTHFRRPVWKLLATPSYHARGTSPGPGAFPFIIILVT
jgi:hypothetical protein